jgi:hypothetical protein
MDKRMTIASRFALTAAAAAALALAPDASAQSRGRGIEMGQLDRLDAWNVGAVGRQDGAVEGAVWSRSSGRMLGSLFDQVPAEFGSLAAQDLARLALASPGAGPGSDAEEAGRKRFEALARMGEADDVTLMAGVGALASDPTIAQYAAQSELARGRFTEACQRARGSTGAPPPFTLRLRALCSAVEGDAAGAQLALALARDAGAEDAWFSAVVGTIGGPAPARPQAARYDASLNAATSLAAGLAPGRNPLASASTLALLTVSRTASAPVSLRAAAALEALSRGVGSVDETRAILRESYAANATGAGSVAAAIARSEAQPGSMEAASAIAAALRAATAHPDFAAAAAVLRPDIAQLVSAPDAAATLLFARAALAAGDARLSQRLLGAAETAGADIGGIASLQAALAANSSEISEEDAIAAVRRRIENQPGPGASRDAAILAAIGFPMDAPSRAALIAQPPGGGAPANAGLLAALHAAVEADASGEAAMIAALIAAPGPARLDTESLTAVLRALVRLELYPQARALAVEALLSRP